MATPLDAHGQPLDLRLCGERLHNRALDELVGMCKGTILDGQVNEAEAKLLKQWLEANAEYARGWPFNILYQNLHRMLIDQTLDEQEQKALLQLLKDLTGGVSLDADIAAMSTTLPLNKPPPAIDFKGKRFVATGRFVYGTRARVEKEIVARGGEAAGAVTHKTHYVVVGLIGSAQWMHSTHGRKIEMAMHLRDEERKLVALVSELHWTEALERFPLTPAS